MADERVIAIGLLTLSDLERLGATFSRLWPLDENTDFADLLRAIDEAEGKLRRELRAGARS
jgi:hypothetical protein